MAWDNSNPTDTTKIRNLGVVIRPNWLAIEQGDSTFKPQALNFADRTAAGVAVDPTAIADAFTLYCKTDAAGNSELFGINDNSDVIQLTAGAPSVASEGTSFLPGGLIIKWGTTTATNVGITKTFPTAFPNNCYAVFLTESGSLGSTSVYVFSKAAANFVAKRSSGPGTVSLYYFALGN